MLAQISFIVKGVLNEETLGRFPGLRAPSISYSIFTELYFLATATFLKP